MILLWAVAGLIAIALYRNSSSLSDPDSAWGAMANTLANPGRFDDTMLFPNSSWEFTKWNGEDAVGFIICVAIAFTILFAFWGILRLAAG